MTEKSSPPPGSRTSESSIRRLSWYCRTLKTAGDFGEEHLSSRQLAKRNGVTSAQEACDQMVDGPGRRAGDKQHPWLAVDIPVSY